MTLSDVMLQAISATENLYVAKISKQATAYITKARYDKGIVMHDIQFLLLYQGHPRSRRLLI